MALFARDSACACVFIFAAGIKRAALSQFVFSNIIRAEMNLLASAVFLAAAFLALAVCTPPTAELTAGGE